MKKTLMSLLLLFAIGMHINAQEKEEEEYTLLLTGASFATSNNGWFEIGARHLNAKALNRAVGGEAIVDTANRMAEGTLYSPEELEEIDAFVIMQVHEKDVVDLSALKEDYTDYVIPFDRSNYAAAYDYVIKRYTAECYNLKFDPKSKYYKSFSGKPAIIVLSTHWHDSRVIYNSSIRVLGERWGLPVIEFDKNIGFSRSQVHPVTKEQMSKLYTDGNEQDTHGVTYGWHPENGEDKYLQQRMAAIFVDVMRRILPIK